MKTLPFFRWAEAANYTADGSGNPWRTGSSPTKVLPPPGFATEGAVPNDRYAAQWENSVKNTTGLALQSIRKSQLLRYSRTLGLPATSGYLKCHAPYWNNYQNAWISIGTAGTDTNTVAFRDVHGYAYKATVGTTNPANFTNRSAWIDTGNPSTSYGVIWFADGATTKAATGLVAYPMTMGASLGAPATGSGSAQATVVMGTGNGIGVDHLGVAVLALGTLSGVPSVFVISSAGAVSAVSLPGTPNASVRDGFLVRHPTSGLYYIFAASPTNTSVYTSTDRTTWTQVYNGANLFGGHPIYAPPTLDTVNARWVFTVATPNAYSTGSLTRFNTTVYTAPVATPSAIVALRNFSGISVAKTCDLGNGNVVGVCMSYAGNPGATTDAINLGLCASTDFGVTWTVAGSDFQRYTDNTTTPFSAQHLNTNFAYQKDKSLLFNYTSNWSTEFMQLGLHVPVDSLASY